MCVVRVGSRVGRLPLTREGVTEELRNAVLGHGPQEVFYHHALGTAARLGGRTAGEIKPDG